MTLQTSEIVALFDVWNNIKKYIPKKDQQNAAEQYIMDLENHYLADFSVNQQEFYGMCDLIDFALRRYQFELDGLEDEDDEIKEI